jgi:hypothetical protein
METQQCIELQQFSVCSTTGALEAAHAQATGKMVLLSEQQLVDCAGDFNNFGCGGGLPSQAFEYIRYNGGLDTEEAYPYDAKDGTCKFLDNKVGAKVYDVVNITEVTSHQLVFLSQSLSSLYVTVYQRFKLSMSNVFSKRLVYLLLTFLWTSVYLLPCPFLLCKFYEVSLSSGHSPSLEEHKL